MLALLLLLRPASRRLKRTIQRTDRAKLLQAQSDDEWTAFFRHQHGGAKRLLLLYESEGFSLAWWLLTYSWPILCCGFISVLILFIHLKYICGSGTASIRLVDGLMSVILPGKRTREQIIQCSFSPKPLPLISFPLCPTSSTGATVDLEIHWVNRQAGIVSKTGFIVYAMPVLQRSYE